MNSATLPLLLQYGLSTLMVLTGVFFGWKAYGQVMAWRAGQTKTQKAKLAVPMLTMRLLMVLACLWGLFSITTWTPKGEMKTPTVSLRVDREISREKAAPATAVVPSEQLYERRAGETTKKVGETRESFEALPDDE